MSARGPTCADLLVKAALARVVIAAGDPDPRTNDQGIAILRAAGVDVMSGVMAAEARAAMAGYFTRRTLGRPHVTLKLALSLDGYISMASGASQWITGPEARAHGHLERALADVILVGGGTLRTDQPTLNVRLLGLAERTPQRAVLTHGDLPADWLRIAKPEDISTLPGDYMLIEGGASAAAAFLQADLIDRLLLYRAPILIGGGKASLGDIGLTSLAEAHGRWVLASMRRLGKDSLEEYQRIRG